MYWSNVDGNSDILGLAEVLINLGIEGVVGDEL